MALTIQFERNPFMVIAGIIQMIAVIFLFVIDWRIALTLFIISLTTFAKDNLISDMR